MASTPPAISSTPSAVILGSFSTGALDVAARRLRRNGVAEHAILERIYRPFIVEGPAAWTDSWHAPRYAGGFHLHEGQDVFCRYGAPVLAAVEGRVEFGTDTLGGNVARLFTSDGSYYYYAHLSAWNTRIGGSMVRAGDVIGYCGNSGDAIGSAPHVHFGHYLASGIAVDPMRQLIRWLQTAEARRSPAGRPSEPSSRALPNDSPELGAEPSIAVKLMNQRSPGWWTGAGVRASRARSSSTPSPIDTAVVAFGFIVSALVAAVCARRRTPYA